MLESFIPAFACFFTLFTIKHGGGIREAMHDPVLWAVSMTAALAVATLDPDYYEREVLLKN